MSIVRAIWIGELPTEFVSNRGERFRVEPGYFSAEFNTLPYTKCPGQPYSQHLADLGQRRGLRQMFVILYDSEGNCFRYWTVFSPKAFLTIEGVLASSSLHASVGRPAAIRTKIDPRGWLKMSMDDTTTFHPKPDHDRFEIEMKERTTGLDVRLITFRSIDRSGSDAPEATAVDFHIPIEKVLWRQAPKILSDDIIPEGEDYVHFERIGHVSDPGAPQSLLPCPIRVVG